MEFSHVIHNPLPQGREQVLGFLQDSTKDGDRSGHLPNDQHICKGTDSLPNIAEPWLYPSRISYHSQHCSIRAPRTT